LIFFDNLLVKLVKALANLNIAVLKI